VQDFAGNVGVSEVFNYELDTLYLGRLLKVNEQGTDFNSVLVTVCSTESNELDCEDVYRTFSERVNPNIFNDDFNSEAAFLIQTLSDEVVTGVDLKFSYLSYAAQHDIENQIVAAEIMDFEQAQNYFTTRERLSNEGLPPGMIKFRSNETDIYAYMILIDQDRLLKPHEFVSTPVDQIAVRAEFIDYHRENYFSLAFHFLTEGQFEWFGRVDNDFNSDYYPDFIQDQDFREKFDAMEEVVFNSGLEIYDAHYWFYSSTNRNPYDSGSIKIKFNDPDLDPVSLSPIYEDYPSDGSVSQLFGVNVENCIGIDKVTFSYEGSEFSAAGVGNGLCLLEDGSYQKFQTQSYCEPLAAQDDLIRLVIGGLFNGANTELASIEVFEVIDGVENIFYTNTNPVATPNEDEEDAVLYIDEFQMDKADFLEGEYDFFVRFSDVEGNQFIYSGSYIVQHENVTPQIIEPQELTKYCATGDEEGDIEIPTNIYLNSNSAYFGSVLNSNNNQYILANDEVFNYDDFESKFSLNNGFSGSLKFDMPYFKGLVSLVFETTNTTGVSSCDVVNIEVDSLLDVVVTDKTIEGDLYTQYIPTYVSDLVADEYSHILTNENIEVKVDLYEADGNTLSTHLELLDTFSGSAGQEFSLVWNGQIAGVDAPDGQYFIQLTITDECGLVRYTKNKLIVDRTAPMLNFIQPLDGATVSSLVEVIAGVSDINYEDSSLEFEVNGVWTEINAEVSTVVGGTDKEVTASWLLTELNTGAYPLRITASDKANNESSLTITVNLGESQNLFWNFALSPSYISPNSDAIQDAALITFGLNLNAFVSLHVEDDNQTIIKQLVSNATYDQGSHELFWNGQNDLDQVVTDGVYQVVITASEIGNPGNSQQLSYSLVSDVTLPTVGIDPEGDVIKGEGLMALAVQEANLAQLKAWINRVDSTDPDTLILETNNTGNLNILDLSELSEDDFRLKIEAIDRAGNQLVRLHQFEIDNTKPEVLLINPEIDSFQGGESASIDIN
ncbi:MAG: Ig-like domain-containing protein, partial [Marinicella sp.]